MIKLIKYYKSLLATVGLSILSQLNSATFQMSNSDNDQLPSTQEKPYRIMYRTAIVMALLKVLCFAVLMVLPATDIARRIFTHPGILHKQSDLDKV